jgi:hypothetical protein
MDNGSTRREVTRMSAKHSKRLALAVLAAAALAAASPAASLAGGAGGGPGPTVAAQ